MAFSLNSYVGQQQHTKNFDGNATGTQRLRLSENQAKSTLTKKKGFRYAREPILNQKPPQQCDLLSILSKRSVLPI